MEYVGDFDEGVQSPRHRSEKDAENMANHVSDFLRLACWGEEDFALVRSVYRAYRMIFCEEFLWSSTDSNLLGMQVGPHF